MKSLIFKDVSFQYNASHQVFENVSFELSNPKQDQGHIIALMGASGAGKSTALKLMMRLLTPQSGSVITNPANPIISYVPQEAVLFEHLSAMENARYFARILSYKHAFDLKLFNQLCEVLDMQDILRRNKNVTELSGGQRQRLSLIRALSVKPDFLLLDEPTTGLDSEVKLQLLHKIREIVLDQKLLAIYISHHKVETELLVDEVIYMNTDRGGANTVHKKDILSFIEIPPVTDAVKVFGYPKPNLICCKIGNQNELQITLADDQDGFYLAVGNSEIIFSDAIGFDYKVVNSNPVYSQLQLGANHFLTINSALLVEQKGAKIMLDGTLLKYTMDGNFDQIITLVNHQIILQ